MGKHKEWRKLAKKLRRKRIRQQCAKQLAEDEERAQLCREQSPSYQVWLEEQRKAEEFQEQEEARLAAEQEKLWLKREEEAHKHWLELQDRLALAREERAKQTARIKEEWEREQKRLKELQEKKEKEAEEKLKRQEELQLQINDFIENGGDVPEELNINFETNPLKPTCPFFLKTGACRFKDTCSRNHVRPGISRVLLIPNFYSHYSLQQTENEHGNDFTLEFENQETYEDFKQFFNDVLPEMEKCGRVRQFKVCCNQEIHLRGNVYVEYSSFREAVKSYRTFLGRWYGGKQLHVEFCNIESWKSAICGLYARQKCPKGSSCNFLHVFSNPSNLFASADKDLHRTPPINMDYESSESDARNWRWSESPERIPSTENHDTSHTFRTHKERRNHHRRRHSPSQNAERESHYRKRSRSSERHRTKSSSRRRSRSTERRKSKTIERRSKSSERHKSGSSERRQSKSTERQRLEASERRRSVNGKHKMSLKSANHKNK